MPSNSLFGNMPSINALLEQGQLKPLMDRFHRSTVVTQVRTILEEFGGEVSHAATERRMPNLGELAEKIVQRIQAQHAVGARGAINATGAILHPCLGEPPLAESAWHASAMLQRDYTLASATAAGGLSGPWAEASLRLAAESGAEAAWITTSRAAALLLTFSALAADRSVILSRSQMVELAGGWRLTDIARSTRTQLMEVGTVNVTRLDDYRQALGPQVAAILQEWGGGRRNPGSDHPDRPSLAALASEHETLLIEDLANGPIKLLQAADIDLGPSATEVLARGVDLVLIEGHGLVGGPACGIILGRRNIIERIAQHPWARAALPSQSTAAALSATLALHADPATAARELPVLRLLETSIENLRNRAERLAPQIAASGLVRQAVATHSSVGLDNTEGKEPLLPTWKIALTPEGRTADELAEHLQRGPRPIVARVEGELVILDLRSVLPDQDAELVGAFEAPCPADAGNGHAAEPQAS